MKNLIVVFFTVVALFFSSCEKSESLTKMEVDVQITNKSTRSLAGLVMEYKTYNSTVVDTLYNNNDTIVSKNDTLFTNIISYHVVTGTPSYVKYYLITPKFLEVNGWNQFLYEKKQKMVIDGFEVDTLYTDKKNIHITITN